MTQARDGREFIRFASNRPGQMMAAYRTNMKRGGVVVRNMILEDIRRFSDLGALACDHAVTGETPRLHS